VSDNPYVEPTLGRKTKDIFSFQLEPCRLTIPFLAPLLSPPLLLLPLLLLGCKDPLTSTLYTDTVHTHIVTVQYSTVAPKNKTKNKDTRKPHNPFAVSILPDLPNKGEHP
jgi:hypothetical protein